MYFLLKQQYLLFNNSVLNILYTYYFQEEVNNGKLIYRDEYSADTKQNRNSVVELGVFDGKHSIDLKLQVESSPPFIKVLNNSQLMLRQGGAATITTNHIYADTNLNIHSDKIK